ncbi:MAG: hypothetical protein ABGZ35_32605 [Planctomycetaceae bacterium]
MNLPNPGPIRVAFWNLQNLFDIEPSPIASELGFSTISGWDRRALEARVTNLASAIRGMFDGDGPDLIGLAEVENERVAQHLMKAVGRDDYVLVTAKDPQLAATGTALIYSERVFANEPVLVRSHCVHLRFPTCDILEVQLTACANDADLTVLVNHWPSRRELNSDAFRQTTASYCAKLIEQHLKLNRPEYVELADSELSRHLLNERWNRNLLLMGSFNDAPWAKSIHDILNAGFSLRAMERPLPVPLHTLPSWRSYAGCRPELFNPGWSLLSIPDQGTCVDPADQRAIRIDDQMILSRGIITGSSGLQVTTDDRGVPALSCLSAETLAARSGHPMPFDCETYDGFSDRLPVGLTLEITPPAPAKTVVVSADSCAASHRSDG